MPEPNPVTIIDVMREYAANAVEYAKSRYGIDLDYSEASLEHVDRMLADTMQGEVIKVDNLTPENQEELWVYCKMMGGYVGEVIARNLGGTWQLQETDAGSSLIMLMIAGKIEAWPVDSVWRTLTEPFRCMVSYYRGVRVVLGRGTKRVEGM